MSKLTELITEWESFTEKNPEGTIESFAETLIKKTKPSPPPQSDSFKADDEAFEVFMENIKITMQAGYLIGKLNQYLQHYSKPIMKKYGMHSMDDFGYLATVDWHGIISKTKACSAMMHEVTTGTDIIKRLIRISLLKETADKEDKRQRLLQLTAKGKKVLAAIQNDFMQLPDVLGDMNNKDRRTIVNWLMELDNYHEKIVTASK